MIKYKTELKDKAKNQIIKSSNYYEDKQKYLGDDFIREVEKTIERISENPYQFPRVGYDNDNEIRRALTNRFPFKIFYIIRKIIEVFRVSSSYQDTSDVEKQTI